MTLTFDIVLSGLVLGGMYALIALGLTLQYGIARIINLSYGESLVAAAFAALYLYTGMAVNPLLGLILVVPASFAANWLLYQIVLMPLVKRAKNQGMLEVDSILGTFGILFVIQGVMLVVFGGTLQSYSYLSVPVHILGTTLAAGYVAGGTDTGHSTNGASFALGHPEKMLDFGYRAVHVTTVVGKALISALYGEAPKESYFSGCSTGGRMAMNAVQRYPTDFNGVITTYPSATTDGTGAFSANITIPAGAALGAGKIRAKSAFAGVTGSKTFTVN